MLFVVFASLLALCRVQLQEQVAEEQFEHAAVSFFGMAGPLVDPMVSSMLQPYPLSQLALHILTTIA
jgi:hypothetical protein